MSRYKWLSIPKPKKKKTRIPSIFPDSHKYFYSNKNMHKQLSLLLTLNAFSARFFYFGSASILLSSSSPPFICIYSNDRHNVHKLSPSQRQTRSLLLLPRVPPPTPSSSRLLPLTCNSVGEWFRLHLLIKIFNRGPRNKNVITPSFHTQTDQMRF